MQSYSLLLEAGYLKACNAVLTISRICPRYWRSRGKKCAQFLAWSAPSTSSLLECFICQNLPNVCHSRDRASGAQISFVSFSIELCLYLWSVFVAEAVYAIQT